MCEQVLYEHLKANYSLPVYFGEAPESQEAPYVVMFVLDSDGRPLYLCDAPFDSGDSFIQFNVFDYDAKNSFYNRVQLDKLLTALPSLTYGGVSYKIDNITHGASPSAQTLNNGLAVDVLAKTFNYSKVT